MALLNSFAYNPSDSSETRLEKVAALIVAGTCCLAGLAWSGMYYLLFGFGLTAFLPFSFVIIVGTALLVSHRTRNHYYAVYAQILCIMYITLLIQWSIGGLLDSGFVMVWSFLGPVTALMFFSPRKSIVWFLLYMVNILVTVYFDGYFSSNAQLVSDSLKAFFFVMNLGIFSIVLFIFSGYFVSNALAERKRANQLLLNVLPKKIAERLMINEGIIAERFEEASVLFADIVGSTPLFGNMEPTEVVAWLNEVFQAFDTLVEKYGLEKIRTIGDNYMVVAGAPIPKPDHAQAIVALGLEILQVLEAIPERNGKKIMFRIGINSGPLVGGVIGKSKFHYDVWGDMVNVASRMESHGEVGRVHISHNTYERVQHDFECEPRGVIEVKGKGKMQTYYVHGRQT